MSLLKRAMENAPSAETRAAQVAERAALEAAETEMFVHSKANSKIIPGKGIFMGIWQPKEIDTNLLSAFNVFAAPHDLLDKNGKKVALAFNAASDQVAGLTGWHAHHGIKFENKSAFYTALMNGGYKGQWFVPTKEILSGTDTLNGLYENKEKGDFIGAITLETSQENCYRYCTLPEDNRSDVFWAQDFSDGHWVIISSVVRNISCRPYRIEPIDQLKL